MQTRCSGARHSLLGRREQTDDDSYEMYIQIMKSVADIIKSKNC